MLKNQINSLKRLEKAVDEKKRDIGNCITGEYLNEPIEKKADKIIDLMEDLEKLVMKRTKYKIRVFEGIEKEDTNHYWIHIFIKKLEEIREEVGTSKKDTAKELGITTNMYARWRNGTSTPTEKEKVKILETLKNLKEESIKS